MSYADTNKPRHLNLVFGDGLTINEKGVIVTDMDYIHKNQDCSVCVDGVNTYVDTNFATNVVNTFDSVITCSGLDVNDFFLISNAQSQAINDGGSDIYDSGNIIEVNGTRSNYSSFNPVEALNSVNVLDGSPFIHRGIVFHHETVTNLITFSISGNYGSDSNTQVTHEQYETTVNGKTYFVVWEYKTGDDPNLHTVMYAEGVATDYTVNFTNNTDNYNMVMTKIVPSATVVGNVTIARKTPQSNEFTTAEIKAYVDCHLQQTH